MTEFLKKILFDKKKLFFITSNQTKLDEHIEYKIKNIKGLTNLKAGNKNAEYKEEMKNQYGAFSFYINSVEIKPEDLKDEDKDKKSNKYKVTIYQRYNKTNFESDSVYFSPSKNNFIFNFKFNIYKGWGKTYQPPLQKDLSLFEQLKLYIKYLRNLKIQQKEQIFKDLIIDAKSQCLDNKIYLDFFLEIFINCYFEKDAANFLDSFKIENILLPDNFIYTDYQEKLNLIEDKLPELTKHFSENEDKKEFYIKFYTFLFFVKYNYEREKTEKMLKNKNLWQYLKIILPNMSKYYSILNIPKDLMNDLFDKNLTVKRIINILNLFSSIENLLTLINDKIEIISNCCINEKELILMSAFRIAKRTDDLAKIEIEIKKIIIYEKNNNKIFISFDENFWNMYIIFLDEIKKLNIIKDIIVLCSNIDKTLNRNNYILNDKIHKIGMNAIKEGALKNEELINFIKNDPFFSDNKYAEKYYRPLEIVNCLDFNLMTNNFFNKWNETNIFKIYSFADSDLKIQILEKVKHINNFGKLLKLFYFRDNKNIDCNLFRKLMEKFKNLLTNFEIKNCPSFVEDVSYFIYIIDSQEFYDVKKFITEILDPCIYTKIKNDIYVYILKNYENLSKKLLKYLLICL